MSLTKARNPIERTTHDGRDAHEEENGIDHHASCFMLHGDIPRASNMLRVKKDGVNAGDNLQGYISNHLASRGLH